MFQYVVGFIQHRHTGREGACSTSKTQADLNPSTLPAYTTEWLHNGILNRIYFTQ